MISPGTTQPWISSNKNVHPETRRLLGLVLNTADTNSPLRADRCLPVSARTGHSSGAIAWRSKYACHLTDVQTHQDFIVEYVADLQGFRF